MKKIWSVIRGFLVLIGLMVVALAVLGAVGFKRANPKLPERMVLSYVFYGTPKDAPAPPPWVSQFMPASPTLADVTASLYKAAKDPRVEALAVQLAAGQYNWADVQELRAAITAFKASGKRTYVYSESYGELSSGMAIYYLASVFDEIWLQPIGGVGITGFHAEIPYFKKLLDTVGVAPDIIQKGYYKTAPESALLEHMSDAQRDSIKGMLASMTTDFFDAVALGRKMPAAGVGALIDGAPYTADQAKAKNLVDTIGYADELMTKIVPEDGPKLVHVMDYLSTVENVQKQMKSVENNQKNGVALLYLNGAILSGRADGLAGDTVYADDVADSIKAAVGDPEIAAIVLRVVSPGGSPAASETIRRAVTLAKTKGKYVVVSMGSVAASGGYWVSVDADKIYAQNGTFTGSIGVFGGKINLAGVWDKIGVNWDSVTLGANATMWSGNRAYTDTQRAAVSGMLDQIYVAFTQRVANGRQLPLATVENIAQGRVWTGRQALDHKLVDGIGGLRQALDDVAIKLGVGDASALNVVQFSQVSDPFQEIRSVLLGGLRMFSSVSPFLREMSFLHDPSRAVVYAPDFAIID